MSPVPGLELLFWQDTPTASSGTTVGWDFSVAKVCSNPKPLVKPPWSCSQLVQEGLGVPKARSFAAEAAGWQSPL